MQNPFLEELRKAFGNSINHDEILAKQAHKPATLFLFRKDGSLAINTGTTVGDITRAKGQHAFIQYGGAVYSLDVEASMSLAGLNMIYKEVNVIDVADIMPRPDPDMGTTGEDKVDNEDDTREDPKLIPDDSRDWLKGS